MATVKTLVLMVAWLYCSAVFAANQPVVRIGLFHMKPKLGELQHNTEAIQHAIELAASHGVDWLVTPELAISGYRFAREIGTDWIEADDIYVAQLQHTVKDHALHVFIGHATRDHNSGALNNSLLHIDRKGDVKTIHHKINTIPMAEDWASKGMHATVTTADAIPISLQVCADAWPSQHAMSQLNQGAQLIINAATWPPGDYGPKDTWQKRSQETQLPIFVANRTGIEQNFDIRSAESVVAFDGKVLLRHHSETAALVMVDWHLQETRIVHQGVLPMQ